MPGSGCKETCVSLRGAVVPALAASSATGGSAALRQPIRVDAADDICAFSDEESE